MRIDAGPCVLRLYQTADRDALAIAANDVRIARNLTEMFPHPYTERAADEWIERCLAASEPWEDFAIEVDGTYSGGIGLRRGSAEKRHVAMIGYWIKTDLWGRGIATAAVRAFVAYAFATFAVDRLEASVFAWNPASARVLTKCGFSAEGHLRDRITRFGETTDELMFGLLRSEHDPPG